MKAFFVHGRSMAKLFRLVNLSSAVLLLMASESGGGWTPGVTLAGFIVLFQR